MKHFYEIPVKVRRGQNCPMPSNLKGAYVCCYIITSSDHLKALKSVVNKLKADGYIFEDLFKNKIQELDPHKWDKHIDTSWSEYKKPFPTQENLLRAMETEQIFYGPFCGWDSE